MGVYNTRPTNGVSFGTKYTVTSEDASDGYVTFDYRTQETDTFAYDLVAIVQVLTASGVLDNPSDLQWTYPYYGVVKVEGTLVEGTVIQIIPQRAN